MLLHSCASVWLCVTLSSGISSLLRFVNKLTRYTMVRVTSELVVGIKLLSTYPGSTVSPQGSTSVSKDMATVGLGFLGCGREKVLHPTVAKRSIRVSAYHCRKLTQ